MAEHSTVEDSEAASTSGESSESTRSSQLVSFLDRLKSPRPSDLARKRKIGTNPPPKGKRTCRGQGTTATELKGVTTTVVDSAGLFGDTEPCYSRTASDVHAFIIPFLYIIKNLASNAEHNPKQNRCSLRAK